MNKCNIFLSSAVALFLWAGVTKAQVFMVVKGDVSTPYNNLEEAVEAAEEGSTVYIPTGEHSILKSPTIVGSVRTRTLLIDKRLTLMGAGADEGALNATSLVGSVTITEGASGSRFEGLTITSYLRMDNVSNFLMKRCKVNNLFQISGKGDGNLFRESQISQIVGYISLYGSSGFSSNVNIYTEILVQNCVLTSSITNVKKGIFTNNVFTYNSTPFTQVHQSVIVNNIFTQTGVVNLSSSTSSWNNATYNLFVGSLTGTTSNNNYAADNITGVAYLTSIFEDQVLYQLKADSPGKNAGSDGTDMGLYGGAFPAKEQRIPAYPVVTAFSAGGATAADGVLPVRITVEAQDR